MNGLTGFPRTHDQGTRLGRLGRIHAALPVAAR